MSLQLPKHQWGTRGINSYQKIECIGAGTYGQVYMAKSKQNDEVVAIKKIRSLNEVQGLPVTTIREIKVLKCLTHKNLVELKEVVVSADNEDDDGDFADKEETLDYAQGSIYLVLEYVEHDLTGLIDRQYPFNDIEIKYIMKQLFEVMDYMHSLDIVHRDIKCSNLLLTKNLELKVADFGLARSMRGDQLFTNKVVTLWYRAPELLLGATSYDASIDMWSIGCVLAELFIGHPLFQGKAELEQINKIFDLCGTPTLENWPDYKFLPNTSKFVPEKSKPRRLREYLMKETQSRKRIFPKGALELIDNLLALDPEQRMSAKNALQSSFFHTRPFVPDTMKPITNLPPSHEYQTKKIRKEQAKGNLQAGSNAAGTNTSNQGGTDTGAAAAAAAAPAAAAPAAPAAAAPAAAPAPHENSPMDVSTNMNPSPTTKEENKNKRKRKE